MIPGLKKRVFNFHDVLMYVAVARKHLRLMVLLVCFSLLCGLTYYVYARPVYYSKSLVQMDYLPLPLDTEKLYGDGRIRAVIREMNSPHVTERAARAMGMDATSRTVRSKVLYKQSVHLTSEKNLEIEVWPGNVQWAAQWPEVLVREYLAYRQEKRIKDREELVEAYLKESELVASKLNSNLDKRFERRDQQEVTETLLKLNTIRSLPAELVSMTRKIDEMGRLRIKLMDPDLDTISKLSLIASLERQNELAIGQQVKIAAESEQPREGDSENRPAGTDLVVVPSMVNSLLPWQDLEKQRQVIKQTIAEAAQTYLPGHQKMIHLNKQLEEVDRKLTAELEVAQNRFALEYQDLLSKRAEYESKLPEYEEITKKTEQLKQDSRLFEASQLPWKNYYAEMKRKIEALDFAGEKERIDLKFMGVLELRDTPVSPNRGRLILFSLLIGGALAIGVPFLLEYLDHTLSNIDEAETTFQLRGLGIVPKLQDESQPTSYMLDKDKASETNIIENFRVIRTNLLSMGSMTKAPHVVMVTSALPREGKTVVSSNLSISFAQTGARTLLMDTDLRRGRLHRLFGYRKSPGLSNVLMGECTLEEALRPTVHGNLMVLSAGKHLDTGTELLGSARFAEIMQELRSRFDRIVMDTPPVLGLSDTSVMQSQVDGVLFVIWSAHTSIRTMKTAIEMLQSNNANFYGFVLNRLDLNASTNYYQYYYYSNDYYYHTQTLENA